MLTKAGWGRRLFRPRPALLGCAVFGTLAAAACGGNSTRQQPGADETAGTGGVPRRDSVGREEGPSRGCQAGSEYGGIAYCHGDYWSRTKSSGCALSPHRTESVGDQGVADECRVDADCVEHEDGYCTLDGALAVCMYPSCTADAHCEKGMICICQEALSRGGGEIALGRCVATGCATNTDCGDDFLCITPGRRAPRPLEMTSYHCQSSLDECSGHRDCTEGGMCSFDGERFACSNVE